MTAAVYAAATIVLTAYALAVWAVIDVLAGGNGS